MRLSVAVPRSPDGPGLARRVIRERFAGELAPAQIADASLIVSELVANAIEHGEGAIHLHLSADRSGIRGEVVDDGGGFEAKARDRGVEELRGRGLWLVSRMARKWGIHEGSSHVWFELELSDSEPRTTAAPELGEAERPDTLD